MPATPQTRCFRATINPARLCRLEESLMAQLRADGDREWLGVGWSLLITIGMGLFGAAFGIWRSPQQALYGAVKMPLMLHAVVWLSVAANVMLNWLLGGGLSLRQVSRCVLAALAVTAVLLGAFAPVVAFLALQAPPPGSADANTAYRILLASLVISVGLAGITGYVRLFRLLQALTPSPAAAHRILLAWILTTGLVGTQCSWLLSPFVQQPHLPVSLWNPAAFSSNFFEHLWFQVVIPWVQSSTGS